VHLLLILLLALGQAVRRDTAPSRPEAAPSVAAAASVPPARDALSVRLRAIGEAFGGDVGIAVREVRTGRTAGYRSGRLYPQQSVAKLWAALAVLDAVDRGTLRLGDPVTVRREDLSIFHQPIRDKVLAQGPHATTIGDLLTAALTQSDNAANQVLVDRVGGPSAVQRVLRAKGLGKIRFGPGERTLQTRIAGLEWRREFSYGKQFWRARAFVPKARRQEAMRAYLADPMDGAAPADLALALARLQRGELLSPASTRLMLAQMAASETGPRRLRGGLKPGWTIAHKTGTGQVLDDLATGYNDAAILTAPDGRSWAVVVMIGQTTRPVPERWDMMAEVARSVIDWHDGVLTRADGATAPPER